MERKYIELKVDRAKKLLSKQILKSLRNTFYPAGFHIVFSSKPTIMNT